MNIRLFERKIFITFVARKTFSYKFFPYFASSIFFLLFVFNNFVLRCIRVCEYLRLFGTYYVVRRYVFLNIANSNYNIDFVPAISSYCRWYQWTHAKHYRLVIRVIYRQVFSSSNLTFSLMDQCTCNKRQFINRLVGIKGKDVSRVRFAYHNRVRR